jgi:hypothetical protein
MKASDSEARCTRTGHEDNLNVWSSPSASCVCVLSELEGPNPKEKELEGNFCLHHLCDEVMAEDNVQLS